MQPVVQAVLESWSVPPVPTFALVLTVFTYLRGTWLLRRAGYPYLPAWRIGCFALGLFTLWFALASPLDTFSPFVLTAHMLQHMLLMMVAPPLILLGEPLIPIVRGMPRFAAREFAGPFLNWKVAERIGLRLSDPVVALVLMGVVMFAWHVPGPYEFALRSSAWHQVEHASFFFTSIIFWWPVVQPWPSRAQWPRWAMVPYLVIADLQNTALSAILVFSDKILYPSYAAGPSLFGFAPQEDQAAAGAMMWVVGSLAFIFPAVLIAVECLSRRRRVEHAAAQGRLFDRFGFSRTGHPTASQLFGIRLTSRSFEAASFVALFLVVAAGFVALSRYSSDDDNQILRLSQQSGSFAIAVYGPASDVPVGPATFTVLVQDAASHNVLLDSTVELSLRKADDARATPQRDRALADDENKLLFSTELHPDSEGPWVVEINVRRGWDGAKVSMPIQVVKPATGIVIPSSCFVLLAVVCLLVGTYLWRHRIGNSTGLPAAVT